MFWQLFITATVFWVIHIWWQRRRIRKVHKEISSGGLPELPVIGHAHLLGGSHEDVMALFQRVARIANEHSGHTTFWLLNKLYLNVTDPVVADTLLKSCLHKDNFTMKYMRTVIGNGSIFAPFNIWRPRRKILAPVFSLKNLNQFVEIFDKQSNVMVQQLKATSNDEDFSLWRYVTTYTFDAVCETTMGVEIKSQLDPDHPFLFSFGRIAHMIAERIFTPWLHPDLIYKNLPIYMDFMKHRNVLSTFINELILKKREELESNNNELPDRNGMRTFLELMILESGGQKGYTDVELCEETMVLMLAGTDTSAVGACYAAVLLSRYQDIQAKLYQELQEVFGDSDRPLTVEDLPNLKYLDAVIKETMRLYPAVPVIVREVHNDVVLPNGTTLVEGVSIFMNIWGLHRNKKYWGEDAELYRPERFLESSLKHPVQFIPFSYATRNCLGYNYAMMSMKTALANLLRNYKLLPSKSLDPSQYTEPLRVKFDIMMKPVDDFIVRLEPRR